MSNDVKTQIIHTSSEGRGRLSQNGWLYLCDGHGDARLTGGLWMYKGNKEIAQQMQQDRWRGIKAQSDRYYSQAWV